MRFTKRQIIFVTASLAAILLIIFFVVLSLPSGGLTTSTIPVYGVDNEKSLEPLFAAFSARYDGKAKINYIRFDEATYEDDLLRVFSGNNPPDVFYFHNRWLLKHNDKVAPISGLVQVSPLQLDAIYPKAVLQDFVLGNNVYALPLYMDTLAIFYNKDMLNTQFCQVVNYIVRKLHYCPLLCF